MSQAKTTSGEPAVRASDTERDQAGEVLRVAYAEGRLTRGELDARIGAAYAATTRGPVRPGRHHRPRRATGNFCTAVVALSVMPADQPAGGGAIPLDLALGGCRRVRGKD
jgi:hypothetical protein